tara:strand:+ start:192 stop:566 length:375 start_codon:yes stop_codon:yes gene_type:complete
MKKKQDNWSCITNCGACCFLAPDQRLEAIEQLESSDARTYMRMVGPDGWCVHFDTGSRRCRIYDERPDFCKVKNLPKLFNVDENKLGPFAIKCCRQQIKSVYGKRSLEIRRFEAKLRKSNHKHD